MISFNSYGEWVYIATNEESDTEVYVETDTIEVEDGYVYWWDLNNHTEPQQEGMISGAMSRGGDCKNNRFINLEYQWFKGSMASGKMGGTFTPEQEWTYPTKGTIVEKVFNYVCDYAGLAQSKNTENSQSEATLIEEGMKAYDNGDYYPEAHDIWLPLARQGNAEAQFHMSLLGGVGIEYLAAKRWLTLSAEQGYAPAIYRLADNYIIGTEFRGYKQDYKKSINLYTQAAEMGHIPSQNALGEFNSYGTYSVLKNPKKGVYWFEKAAKQGSARAQYSLGIIYMGNDGITQDDKKSFYWTKKAAEQGYTLAEYNLGGYYIMGKGVIKSLKDAAYWVKKAYEGGHDNAEKMWNKYELWKYE
jgi:uncharacterized protein